MKHLILFLLLISLFTEFSYSQNNNKSPFKIRYPKECKLIEGNDSTGTFYISTQPITNHAYIIYMNWLMKCYTAYPEQWYHACPDLGKMNGEIDYADCSNFVELINKSDPLVKEYMFNPKYLDYPVLGIDWVQATNFCKWLADRYNEFVLMDQKFLSENSLPQNENCFTIESYLAGQYFGNGDKELKDEKTGEVGVKWKHHLLSPSFRLPTQLESTIAGKNILSDLKPYVLPSYLKPWECLKLKGNKLIMTDCISDNQEEFGFQSINSEAPKAKISEWFLDTFLELKDNSVLSVYSKLGQNQLNYDDQIQLSKDSLGHMRYLIIMEKNKQALIVNAKPTIPKHDADSKSMIFRYAVSAVKED